LGGGGGGGGVSHILHLNIYMNPLWQQQNLRDTPPKKRPKTFVTPPPPFYIKYSTSV
jgi:hypothetical protein